MITEHCDHKGCGFKTSQETVAVARRVSQIAYRLKKGVIKRSDYRNGASAMAQRVVDKMIPGNNNIRDTLNLK